MKTKAVDVVKGEVVLDKRKQDFLEYYWQPASESFGNVYQSAVRAGYSHSYSRVLATPAINNNWVREYSQTTDLTAEHIIKGIERIAVRGFKERDQLRALELLAKLKGMIVDKSISAHVNIEQALKDLK